MGKPKTPGLPNKPAFCRMSFLYQASAYLATVQTGEGGSKGGTRTENDAASPEAMSGTGSCSHDAQHELQNRSRALLSDMRQVSLKTQLRLSSTVKHSVCKFCDTMLIEGQSCVSVVENTSRGGRKPWVDALVRKCNTCGREKRFPVDAPRQKRRHLRDAERKTGGR